MVRWIAGFVVVVGTLIAGLIYSQQPPSALTVSGFIEADEIRLGSRVGGRVAKVLIEEGQQVQPGDLLVELEPFDLMQRQAEAEALWNQRMAVHEKLVAGYREEEIAQAEARLDSSKANLLMLKNGPRQQEIEAAKAEVDLAKAEQELAQEVYDRTAGLVKQGASTQEALDRATKERAAAAERVKARQEQLDLLLQGTRDEEIAMADARMREQEQATLLMKNGYRDQQIAEAYSAMKAAESALAAIDQQLEELKVHAPSTGTIEAVDLQVGDLVSANAPVVSMIDTQSLWVRAYVPEDQLDINLGQQVPITVDSYPNETFTGEITFIARQAEFTPGNVQTPEERSKQVFRIKVTLVEGHDRLRAGMAADVWLEGHP